MFISVSVSDYANVALIVKQIDILLRRLVLSVPLSAGGTHLSVETFLELQYTSLSLREFGLASVLKLGLMGVIV